MNKKTLVDVLSEKAGLQKQLVGKPGEDVLYELNRSVGQNK